MDIIINSTNSEWHPSQSEGDRIAKRISRSREEYCIIREGQLYYASLEVDKAANKTLLNLRDFSSIRTLFPSLTPEVYVKKMSTFHTIIIPSEAQKIDPPKEEAPAAAEIERPKKKPFSLPLLLSEEMILGIQKKRPEENHDVSLKLLEKCVTTKETQIRNLAKKQKGSLDLYFRVIQGDRTRTLNIAILKFENNPKPFLKTAYYVEPSTLRSRNIKLSDVQFEDWRNSLTKIYLD